MRINCNFFRWWKYKKWSSFREISMTDDCSAQSLVKLDSFEPDSNQWPMDRWQSFYSPPLYQLSYRRVTKDRTANCQLVIEWCSCEHCNELFRLNIYLWCSIDEILISVRFMPISKLNFMKFIVLLNDGKDFENSLNKINSVSCHSSVQFETLRRSYEKYQNDRYFTISKL